ncbi:MAG: hypothetical protein RSF92_11240 [Niameybacter sp.]|uniref:hypothetical protein n=1 Tax=Niameybacter sp. TaxID=2033640 RepID=UPI002FC9D6FF
MTFELNTHQIKLLDKSLQQCLEKTAESVHTEIISAQVMPFNEGDMQNSSTFVDYSDSNTGLVSIVTTSPQARRLYFHPEYDFQTINNPNAKGRWYDDWLSGGKEDKFAQKSFSKFLKERL